MASFKDIAPPSKDVVVFTCTFYGSAEDVRYRCCLEFLALARAKGVPVVVVDASPDEAIREAMRAAGAARVVKQTAKGRKGAALREALGHAAEMAPSDSAWLCWQEPEKVDMVRHWKGVAADAMALEVVIPAREPKLFEATYPIEQFHSESFANAYVNLAARDAGYSRAAASKSDDARRGVGTGLAGAHTRTLGWRPSASTGTSGPSRCASATGGSGSRATASSGTPRCCPSSRH